jgi:hypothetical protein
MRETLLCTFSSFSDVVTEGDLLESSVFR